MLTQSNQELVPIRTCTLRAGVSLSFDIYLYISGKHLLYVKTPDNSEHARYSKLVDKHVEQVFIRKMDFLQYENFLRENARSALGSGDMPVATRAHIIGGQTRASVAEMFADPEKRENYTRVQIAAANQVALLLQFPEAIEQMIKIAASDHSIYQHSVNVATLSIGIGAALGAPVDACGVVGIGGLLHDIAKGVPDRYRYGFEEKEIEHQHPRIAAGILQNKRYISKDVLDIILMHEERIDGEGYPTGVRELDQIYQVVGLANFYDRLVTNKGKTPREAFETLERMSPAPYDGRLIRGLKQVLISNHIF